MNSGFDGDNLVHRERTFTLLEQPLELYFELIGSRPAFEPMANRARAYEARWVIEDGWLFMTGIDATWSGDKPVHLNDLFPFAGARVFAAWYSGTIRGYRPERGLPDTDSAGGARYPDLVIPIEHGRMANTTLISRPVTQPIGPRQPRYAGNVIDLADYRNAGINATWAEVMV